MNQEAQRIALDVAMLPQPDETSCGPTALHAVYRYHGDGRTLDQVRADVGMLEDGGTLAVILANDALRRGYAAILYTFNLRLFDPTWFRSDVDVVAKLEAQRRARGDAKLRLASEAYAEFIGLGGVLRMEDLTPQLIREHLARGQPLLVGTSGTYLLDCARERSDGTPDDVAGDPQGHFVVVCGMDGGDVEVADPWPQDGRAMRYRVSVDRLITSVLLGVLTYDGNLLALSPAVDG